MEKEPEAFRTISEVGEELDVPQHVLRFWETRFSQIRPMKRGGGRRYYRVNDIDLLKGIRQLLYGKGYTIKGVQRILKEHGVAYVTDIGRAADEPDDSQPPMSAIPSAPSGMPPKGYMPSDQALKTTTGQAGGLHEAILRPETLTVEQKEELKLALADLAAAKRLLDSENKT